MIASEPVEADEYSRHRPLSVLKLKDLHFNSEVSVTVSHKMEQSTSVDPLLPPTCKDATPLKPISGPRYVD